MWTGKVAFLSTGPYKPSVYCLISGPCYMRQNENYREFGGKSRATEPMLMVKPNAFKCKLTDSAILWDMPSIKHCTFKPWQMQTKWCACVWTYSLKSKDERNRHKQAGFKHTNTYFCPHAALQHFSEALCNAFTSSVSQLSDHWIMCQREYLVVTGTDWVHYVCLWKLWGETLHMLMICLFSPDKHDYGFLHVDVNINSSNYC